MLRLILPCEAYLPSYIAAYDEYCGFPRRNPLRNPHDGDLLATMSAGGRPSTCPRTGSPRRPTGWWTRKPGASWASLTSATS